MSTNRINRLVTNFIHLLLLLGFVLAGGCSQTSTDKVAEKDPPSVPAVPDSDYITVGMPITGFVPLKAAIVTADANYISGAHSIITGDSNGRFTALNDLQAVSGADLAIAVNGDSFYRIERLYSGNNVARFSFSNPQIPQWQYSTNDTTSAVQSNPYAMVFVNESKAYVLRYDSTKVWIVNPSAATAADFKLGELDLSAYGGADGIPDMGAAVIAGGKLFIALQRLENNRLDVSTNGYLAIFDITTDMEIDAGISGDNLKGVPLNLRNPVQLVYEATSNSIFVQAAGSFFPQEFTGGIETIDVDSYATKVVFDDNSTYGQVTAVMPLSQDVVYFIGYRSYDNQSLYVMSLLDDRILPTKVASLAQSLVSTLARDKQGLLWVGDSARASVHIIDPATGDEIAEVSTGLNPLQIVFAP